MPSENYHDQKPATLPSQATASSPRLENEIKSRYLQKFNKAQSNFQNLPAQEQARIQNKLNRLQRRNPALPKSVASKTSTAPKMFSFATDILKKMDLSRDWLFLFVLAPAAFLKDIFDIAFAAIGTAGGWVPVLGQAAIAVGMVVTFVGEILLLCLTVVILVLAGAKISNRGMAKYFVGLSVAFISEALPGIGWLPLAFLQVFVLYGFVLYDRTSEESEEEPGVEAPATA